MEMTYPRELEKAKKERWPVLIPIGTMEYHSSICPYGCDALTSIGLIDRIAEKIDCVVMPPVWYGVASYAVAGPESGTIHVDVDAYENYIYCILKSMIYGGVKNIYCVAHHQTEEAGLMPMTIACHKAAKKVIMEYMEETRGKGWWGSNDYADYYENLGSGDDPFSYIKVVPLIGAEAQKKCGGFDHAGKWETSLLMGTYPQLVDLNRCEQNTERFAQSAVEASEELGKHMVDCTLEWLRETIV
jgi:creatinine amidohydrolase